MIQLTYLICNLIFGIKYKNNNKKIKIKDFFFLIIIFINRPFDNHFPLEYKKFVREKNR
jgi:hypothetical protein